jgi:hypothetical protein
MSAGPEIRCYDYVNRPYDQVRNALSKDALAVFRDATKSAESRAQSIAAELRVNIGSITVGTDIRIAIKKLEEKADQALAAPVTRLQLEWEAASLPGLFPLMKGQLAIYPLTTTETQLDFSGRYEPPLGAVGKAMNAMVGHRLAEAAVHQFVADVAGYLRRNLA